MFELHKFHLCSGKEEKRSRGDLEGNSTELAFFRASNPSFKVRGRAVGDSVVKGMLFTAPRHRGPRSETRYSTNPRTAIEWTLSARLHLSTKESTARMSNDDKKLRLGDEIQRRNTFRIRAGMSFSFRACCCREREECAASFHDRKVDEPREFRRSGGVLREADFFSLCLSPSRVLQSKSTELSLQVSCDQHGSQRRPMALNQLVRRASDIFRFPPLLRDAEEERGRRRSAPSPEHLKKIANALDGEIIFCKNNVCVHPAQSATGIVEDGIIHKPGYFTIKAQHDPVSCHALTHSLRQRSAPILNPTNSLFSPLVAAPFTVAVACTCPIRRIRVSLDARVSESVAISVH